LKAEAALETSTVRVLVVEDYEPFRRFVCSTLRKRPELQIVGQVSDGLEAVQKAEELQPDLITLDIGLPTLNGIEAAQRIRKVAPQSKIIFVSQESSADVVQEALRLGALGYVLKPHAGSELLAAVGAVCEGRRFASAGFADHLFTNATDTQAPDLCHEKVVPTCIPKRAEITRSHEVEFYSDDAVFVVGFTRFIEAALEAGSAVIVVATESHRKSLLLRLREHGGNCAAAIEQGRYLPLDVAETLSTFMVNDLPDSVRFFRVVGDLIAGAQATAREQSRVAICGECASILWAEGNADAAIQVERFCNQLAKRYEMDILCGFSLSSFYREEDKQVFQRICSEH
jgi:DNA-binding NarL/FixJ family response regulator